jgi:anti-sigma regulatory factor (Ser/Thr protein kinase)
MPVRSGEPGGFVHDALYYDSDEELLTVAVPFLRDGLEAGEAVAMACPERVRGLLSAALDDDPRVHLLAPDEIYGHSAVAVSAQRSYVEGALRAGAPRVRIVGEVKFGDTEATWRHWARFESVINVGLAEYPALGLCLYDTRRLPADVLAAGKLTHPYLITGGTRRPNPEYVAPRDYLAAGVPDPLEATRPVLDVHEIDDLRRLRHAVLDAVASTPAGPDLAENFLVAVNEVATNAALHGRPPVRLRLWTSAARSVCLVTDSGAGVQDPSAGYVPAHGRDLSRGGMGLWLARQLCDEVDLTTTPDGFTVRLTIRH